MGVEIGDDGAVVRIGLLECTVFEVAADEPALVGHRPGGPLPEDLSVAQEELGESMPTPGAVDHQVRPGAGQVPDGLFGVAGDVDRGELASTVELGQSAGIALVGLDLGAGGDRDQGGGDDLGRDTEAFEQPGQPITGRTRLVAKTHRLGVAQGFDEAPGAGLVVEPAVHRSSFSSWSQHCRGDRVPMDIEAYPGRVRGGRIALGHGRLLPYGGSVHVIVGNPRHMRIEPADPLSLDLGSVA